MCRIIGFVSAKGGVGKTSIIFHLANELSKKYRVCVFDSYFFLNDISERFAGSVGGDLKDYLTGELGTDNVLRKVRSNLYLVRTNENFDYLKHSELIKFFISELSFRFDYILIDINSFNFRVLNLMLCVSTEIVYICTDDELCVKNTAKLMVYIKNFTKAKSSKFILNKARIIHMMRNKCLNVNDISELLKMDSLFVIPKFYINNNKSSEKIFLNNKNFIRKLSYSIITNKMCDYDIYKRYRGPFGYIRRIRCFKYE
ncbi:MAG: ParA family protein [Clostridia bacterium]|nr:ParA family protein [Clostridia bacterium]